MASSRCQWLHSSSGRAFAWVSQKLWVQIQLKPGFLSHSLATSSKYPFITSLSQPSRPQTTAGCMGTPSLTSRMVGCFSRGRWTEGKTQALLEESSCPVQLKCNQTKLYIERFSNACRNLPKPKQSPGQSQQTEITHWTNQNSKQIHVAGAKRGKTRASKSRLVWVLLLTGRESGARFFNQSQSEVRQNQSKTRITFDTQLKTDLSTIRRK